MAFALFGGGLDGLYLNLGGGGVGGDGDDFPQLFGDSGTR